MGNQQQGREEEEETSPLLDAVDNDGGGSSSNPLPHYESTTNTSAPQETAAAPDVPKGIPFRNKKDGPAAVDDNDEVSYLQLLRDNTNFRYYWISYVANHMGEWMTYLASISLIQEIELLDDKDDESRVNTLISILIVVKLLPNVLFMPLGGVLADLYDRRYVQIGLDIISAFLVFVYLLAVHYRSIFLLYVANFLQECLSGLYIPSNSAMLPMLCASRSESELQKATTLSGLTWSLMAAIGSSTGGVLVALFGVQGCFLIDSATYVISAALLKYGVQGTYVATEEEKQNRLRASSVGMQRTSCTGSVGNNGGTELQLALEQLQHQMEQEEGGNHHENPATTSTTSAGTINNNNNNNNNSSQWDMFRQGLQFAFLTSPLVGAYALLKGCAAMAYGATDVLNVSFSARGNETDPQTTSLKLGILFGCVGVGCIIGSLTCDVLVTLRQPLRIIRLCLGGYTLIALGCLLMGLFPDFFPAICVSGVIRSTGSSLIWINSVLLLQKYSPPTLLGRVRSIDVAVALLGEAVSAMGGGILMDNEGVSPEGLSKLLALIALAFFVFWTPLLAFKTPQQEP